MEVTRTDLSSASARRPPNQRIIRGFLRRSQCQLPPRRTFLQIRLAPLGILSWSKTANQGVTAEIHHQISKIQTHPKKQRHQRRISDEKTIRPLRLKQKRVHFSLRTRPDAQTARIARSCRNGWTSFQEIRQELQWIDIIRWVQKIFILRSLPRLIWIPINYQSRSCYQWNNNHYFMGLPWTRYPSSKFPSYFYPFLLVYYPKPCLKSLLKPPLLNYHPAYLCKNTRYTRTTHLYPPCTPQQNRPNSNCRPTSRTDPRREVCPSRTYLCICRRWEIITNRGRALRSWEIRLCRC